MDCSPIVLAHETPFSVGTVEISPATRELRHNDKSAILEPRVMQVLVALHRANGAVVSKDDLVTCCWEGRIVGDDAINRVIGRLRHDASDHADDAFRIETITRVGYRMVENGASKATAPIDRRWLLVGGTVAAAAGTGAIGWQLLSKPGLPREAQTLVEESRSSLRDGTADQVSNAVAKLRSASLLAPESSEVWGLLALAYRIQLQQLPGDQRALTYARSDAAAKRALAMDPNNGDALAAQVWSRTMYGNWLSLEQAARSALRRNPDHAGLNKNLGLMLAQVGRSREALFCFDRAVRAEPMAPFYQMMRIGTLWDVGRLDDAEQAIDRAFRLWPRHYAVWFSRFYFLTFNGRAQEAVSMISDLANRPVGIPEWNLELTKLEAESIASGEPAQIDAAVRKWRDAARLGTGFAENAIMFAGATGRLDDAYAVIGAYFFDRGFRVAGQRWAKEQGIYSVRGDRFTYMLFSHDMQGVRGDPRFAQLTRETGLDDYWRRSRSRPDYLG